MKKSYFYIIISAAVFVFLAGCMENTDSDSDAGKRALDETSSGISDIAEKETVTTAAELTPLETFVRITAVSTEEALPEKAGATENDTVNNHDDRSEWFSEHELFDIEAAYERDNSETWYRFNRGEEITSTVVSDTENNQKKASDSESEK